MKKIYSLLCVVFVLNVNAQELVALLKSVENNHMLHMVYQQNEFICKPYGVETVSELLLRSPKGDNCLNYIREFRLDHPQEKSFALSILSIKQQYSVKGLGDACLLSLSSGQSYSEALLEQGYARILPEVQYKNFGFNQRLKRAVLRAKNAKAGIWSDVNIRNCFLATQ